MKRRFLRLIALMFVAAGTACAGCADEPEPQPNPETDTGTAEVDMGEEPDPDTGTTEPPPETVPAYVLVEMTPGRETYPLGIRLLPEITVFDTSDMEADYEVEITAEPAASVNRIDDRYELVEEGIVRFTACTVEPGADGEPVCGFDEVVVNVGPPTIEITSPQPGAQLDSTANPTVEVIGAVTDSFGDPVAFVNGKSVELDADGNFSTTLTPRFGINHVEVAATDGLDPATAVAAVDYLWANEYQPPGDPAVDFSEGLVLRLGQLFMDDRQRVMTQPDGTYVTQDLADIFELVVRNFDLSTQIPDPVLDSPELFLRVPSISVGKPVVQIDIVDGGLELFIQMANLQVVTEGDLTFNNTTLDLNGSLTAGMSALIVVSVDKASPADPIDVQVQSLSVAVENIAPNFASAEANAVIELAQSALRTTIEELLVDTLEGTFINEIPTLLSSVFTSLDDVLSNQTVDLDTGLGTPITLSIDGDVRTLDSAFRDHLTATLGLTAGTDVSGVHADSRGFAKLYPGKPDPEFFQQSRIQFGLPFALVNALLHALWDAGLLEADVTEQVPVNVDSAFLSAKLPPVVRPPLEGEPYDFVIELGQVEIETEILGRTDRYGVSIRTGVSFGLDQGALAVEIGDMPEIETWLIASGEDAPFLSADALKGLIETQVWPEFTAAFAGGLSIDLPAPDLSSLAMVSPNLADLVIQFEQTLPLAVRAGWIIIDANLTGTLPVSP